MCYEPFGTDEDVVGVCPTCGENVDSDGDVIRGCVYSPVICKTCGDAPCDGSC